MRTWTCVWPTSASPRKSTTGTTTGKAGSQRCLWNGSPSRAWLIVSTPLKVMWWVYSVCVCVFVCAFFCPLYCINIEQCMLGICRLSVSQLWSISLAKLLVTFHACSRSCLQEMKGWWQNVYSVDYTYICDISQEQLIWSLHACTRGPALRCTCESAQWERVHSCVSRA